MLPRPHSRKSWLSLLLIAAALGLWILDRQYELESSSERHQAETRDPAPESKPVDRRNPPSPAKPIPHPEKLGAYEIYRNCRLAEDRSNDGDSFRIRLPDGREEVFRLYFVDSPESAFRRYANGETNHERIRQQAADLGGITPEQAVEIGKKAKSYVLGSLAASPFTLHTCWDSPFHDHRYHAHIEVKEGGQIRWLDELLVERGLVRIITKPADMPDGTPAAAHKDHLRDLESKARREGRGVWGL